MRMNFGRASRRMSRIDFAIATNGDIYRIAYDAGGLTHAVKWTLAVPQPSSALILSITVLLVLPRHRRVAKSHS